MNETMTLAEIEAQFASEWVLVVDPEVDEHFQVIRGTVVSHSKDRDEVDRKLLELRPQSAATLYTGRIPEDMVIVLLDTDATHTLPPSATIDGLLGLDFLRGQELTLDFRNGQIFASIV